MGCLGCSSLIAVYCHRIRYGPRLRFRRSPNAARHASACPVRVDRSSPTELDAKDGREDPAFADAGGWRLRSGAERERLRTMRDGNNPCGWCDLQPSRIGGERRDKRTRIVLADEGSRRNLPRIARSEGCREERQGESQDSERGQLLEHDVRVDCHRTLEKGERGRIRTAANTEASS
jgi:hypothetical protein